MGESLTEGTVLEWRKQVGDLIEKDEILLEIATDKVDSEIPSPVAGKLVEIIGEVNKTYPVGTVIARIETEAAAEGESPAPAAEASAPPAPEPAPPEQPAPPITTPAPPVAAVAAPGDKRFYSPVVKKMARAAGISPAELAQVPGTGRHGRVTRKDLEAYLKRRQVAPAAAAPGTAMTPTQPKEALPATGLAERLAPEAAEIEEMDTMRRAIARHMRQSLDTAAHVYTMTEVDLTRVMNFLAESEEAFAAREGFKLTLTHFIALAARDALQKFPLVNASLDGTRIIRHRHINLGIAVALGDRGLVVPPVRNAEELTLLGLARAISQLVAKARARKLTLEELEGATFSITNFGVFGSVAGFPIINQPNVAILGVGAARKKPVVLETPEGDVIAIRTRAYFTLGFDHRLIDGALGSRFLEQVKQNLEQVSLEGII